VAFQVKDFISITASMLNWMRATTTKITDYNVGSVARTLVEAPAAEIDELYQQMFIGLKEAIPVATYNSFSFDLLPAVSAAGLIRVSITPSASPILIQAATTFTGMGLPSTYSSIQDQAIPAGSSYLDISVSADLTGATGNISENQSFTLTPAPSGFVSATNLSAISSGRDVETEDERKIRFSAYIDSISRATNAAIQYGLSTVALTDSEGNIVERVATGITVEPYLTDSTKPIALVECYIHNGVGATSGALVTLATKIINGYYDDNGKAVPGYKASGIPAPVYAAAESAVNVAGVLTALTGYDKPTLVTSAETSIYTYLQGLPIGTEAVFSEIVRLVQDLDGVYDFVPSTPLANVPVAANVKIMPGSITIS
jgi:uncharacterized phage protein gp47/JayE